MNIRDLQYAVAVADKRHFGKAATQCHVSQPALSGQIRKLEDTLGVTLFERTNRAVRVTPIGEQIVAQARKLIQLSDEIVATAQAARSPFAGQFRLGMIATIGPYLSPLILSAIRQELPDLSLTLIESLTTDLEKRVAAGELDGAILATAPVDPHLASIALYQEPFRIVLSNTHPLARQKTISLDEIAHEELLLLADGHCLRDQVLEVCHAATGETHANTRQTSLETLLAFVAAGDGVTLAPALAMRGDGKDNGAVVHRRETSGTAARNVRLVSRVSFPQTKLVNRLASIIRANVPAAIVNILE